MEVVSEWGKVVLKAALVAKVAAKVVVALKEEAAVVAIAVAEALVAEAASDSLGELRPFSFYLILLAEFHCGANITVERECDDNACICFVDGWCEHVA